MYFEVCDISDALKPRFAALNFTGPAETWLHTAELRGRFTTWEALHTAVCDRFDKDQYHLHLKHLDNLKQTGRISEYLAHFEQLTHSILLYNNAYVDTYLVTRFLGGLRDDIRSPIALHRPKDVVTASSLALLQEEEVESRGKVSISRSDVKDSGKSGSKVFTISDKSRSQFKEDTRKVDKSGVDDKWSALLAHRKANGLCYTCGEKWTGRSHKCPDQVSIHMLQELMDLFQVEPPGDSESDEEPVSEETVLAVQGPPSLSIRKHKTMRFQGMVGKQDILILLDSRSVGTFVTPELAASLPHLVQSCDRMQYSTVDGSPMVSDT